MWAMLRTIAHTPEKYFQSGNELMISLKDDYQRRKCFASVRHEIHRPGQFHRQQRRGGARHPHYRSGRTGSRIGFECVPYTGLSLEGKIFGRSTFTLATLASLPIAPGG